MSINRTPFTQGSWEQFWWLLKNPIPTSRGFLKKNKAKQSDTHLIPGTSRRLLMPAQLISKCYNKTREKNYTGPLKFISEQMQNLKGKQMLLKQSQLFKERKTCTSKRLHLYIKPNSWYPFPYLFYLPYLKWGYHWELSHKHRERQHSAPSSGHWQMPWSHA